MTNYKLSKEIPSIFPRLQRAFNVEWKDVIVTYGDTIYCADDLPPHSIAHECVHIEQQRKLGNEDWLERYINDPKFRLNIEIPAYQAELKSLRDNPDQSLIPYYMLYEKFAEILSGPMYGNMITIDQARTLLNK